MNAFHIVPIARTLGKEFSSIGTFCMFDKGHGTASFPDLRYRIGYALNELNVSSYKFLAH